MTSELDGLVALVTGAGHGLGASHAKALAAAGAKVVVNDAGVGWTGDKHETSRAQLVAEEIQATGGIATHDGGDVGNWNDAERMVSKAIDEFGKLDILVCNAGIMRGTTVGEMAESDWDAVLQVHVKGTFAPTHFAVRHWREQVAAGQPIYGRVVTTGTRAAFYTSIEDASIAYSTAKGAIHAFTVVLAGELEDIGVTVNCVIPTALTNRLEKMPAWADDPVLLAQKLPERVSPLVVYLASARGAHITGGVFYCGSGTLGRIREAELVSVAFRDRIWTTEELDEWFDRELDGRRYRAPAIDPVTTAQRAS